MEVIPENVMREVSSARSSEKVDRRRRNHRLRPPLAKEQIQAVPLHPQYVAGFIDGEGSFVVGFGRHRTLKRGTEVRLQFSIELRADDAEILHRIMMTIGCGKIYDASYERYGWYPHVTYKIGSTKDMERYLIPFLDRTPLQAKKREVYRVFREIVLMFRRKEHLTDAGFRRIQELRAEYRKYGKKHLKTARVRENRSPGGVGQ